jgi:MFS transporter, DHA2 family, metal-tetracycline-proton antiporter
VPACLGLGRRGGSGARIDVAGVGLLAVAVSALLVLVQAETLGLSTPLVLSAVLATVTASSVLVWHLRRTVTGVVPMDLLRDPTFVRAAAVGAGVYGGLFSMMWGTPQILVLGHGWSVLAVGAALLPGALGGAVLSRLAGRLIGGGRGSWILATCAASAGLCTIGAWLFDSSPIALIVGASCAFAAFAVTQVVTTALMSARIPPERRGGAIGVLNLAFFVGGGLGSSVAGALSHHAPVAAALAMVSALPLAAALLAPGLRRVP